ncbi:GNAT family N-acetyltransferase [Mycolicibacter heraklionensis]|uniref:GNAT family N-acetyltransferase n=1 Tax=Mycolicibacter heraklionensis TaxID=512402 RepID=UPI0009ED79C0|nr:GNAT family N-acetyltransferase [Mycolicibacter heraklionensis]
MDIFSGTDGASSTAAEFSLIAVDPGELENVTFVAPMHMRAWKDCYGKFVPHQHLTSQYNAYAFQLGHQELIREGFTMWLAKSGQQPVGLAIFGPDPKDESRGKIDSLYVDPDWQGRGVGSGLYDEVLGQLDFPVIVLDCAARNLSGRTFWEHRGFRAVGPGQAYSIPGYGDLDVIRYKLDNRPGSVTASCAEPPSSA